MSWEKTAAAKILKDVETALISSSIPGTQLLEASHPSWATPIGTLYWRWTYDGRVEVLHIHVVEPLRRKGIARNLIEDLRARNPGKDLVTQSASKLGKPFLEKCGWIFEDSAATKIGARAFWLKWAE